MERRRGIDRMQKMLEKGIGVPFSDVEFSDSLKLRFCGNITI